MWDIVCSVKRIKTVAQENSQIRGKDYYLLGLKVKRIGCGEGDNKNKSSSGDNVHYGSFVIVYNNIMISRFSHKRNPGLCICERLSDSMECALYANIQEFTSTSLVIHYIIIFYPSIRSCVMYVIRAAQTKSNRIFQTP